LSSVLFLIDKTLGKYKVLEHLGHGGMSEVYKGQHEQLDRMVAVKVLHPFLADEEGFVVRFKREARIVATLRQQNIVQVFDFDYNEELGIYYMVMEYIDGPTLKTRLNDGPLPVEVVARIGIAIAEALEYAHQRGMVHRDVKPANIMFISDEQPVLTDFGIAKMLSLSELTATGAMVGTPAYMAPEVGIGKVGTAASDIYSLGVVLFQAVAGRLPFESDSPMGIVMQHINDPPPPLSRFVPSIPASFEEIVHRALEKQPDARFSRVADMADALRQVIGADAANGSAAALPSIPVVAPTPPLTTRVLSSKVEFDNDERLLRSWSVPAEETPPVGASTLSPQATPKEGETDKPRVKLRRARVLRVVGSLAMLLAIVIIVGGMVWVGIRGDLPIVMRQLLALANISPSEETPSALVVPTITPTFEAVATMTVAPTSVPVTVTPTPLPQTATPDAALAACNVRLRLSQVRIEPDDVVSPESDFVAYVSLLNSGDCAWPKALRLVFVSGEPMTAMNYIPIAALAPNESIHLILPMKAPADVGNYESEWVIKQIGEAALGSPITIRVEVGDVPTPTPLPDGSSATSVPAAPLALGAPELVEWREDTVLAQWYGTVLVQATGGTGTYRYYLGEIRADTELITGQFTVEGRLCEPATAAVWAVSGNEVVSWEGIIDYPEPDKCR
jgi:serine/threonine protein kinase